MKIDNNLPNPWLDAIGRSDLEGVTPEKKSSGDKPAQAGFPEDSLTLRNAGSDDVRAEKVAALQRAVADGSYEVSSESIADAMLREWRA